MVFFGQLRLFGCFILTQKWTVRQLCLNRSELEGPPKQDPPKVVVFGVILIQLFVVFLAKSWATCTPPDLRFKWHVYYFWPEPKKRRKPNVTFEMVGTRKRPDLVPIPDQKSAKKGPFLDPQNPLNAKHQLSQNTQKPQKPKNPKIPKSFEDSGKSSRHTFLVFLGWFLVHFSVQNPNKKLAICSVLISNVFWKTVLFFVQKLFSFLGKKGTEFWVQKCQKRPNYAILCQKGIITLIFWRARTSSILDLFWK